MSEIHRENRRIRRSDPGVAEAVIRQAVPDDSLRQQLTRILADSVAEAHRINSNAWEVTLNEGATFVRLNVGPALVLGIHRDAIWVSLLPTSLPPAVQSELQSARIRRDGFKNYPQVRLLRLDQPAAARLWPSLRDSHFDAMRTIGESSRGSAFRRSHSPGVLEYLSSFLGGKVLTPAYFEPEPIVDRQRRGVREEVRDQIEDLLRECRETYLGSPAGLEHSGLYDRCREEAKRHFERIEQRHDRGEDITDDVLLHLLPHGNTSGNRERGAWRSWAPAVTKDVRTWFEGSGWAKPEDWRPAAVALFELVRDVTRNPETLGEALARFDERCPAKGFQAGLVSPILAALRPDACVVLNNKSRRLINYLASTSFGHSLRDYPGANQKAFELADELRGLLTAREFRGLAPTDALDQFAHWLVAEKRFDFGERGYWKIAPGDQAWNWEACRDGGFIAIGWPALGDLTDFDRPMLNERWAEVAARQGWKKGGLYQVRRFLKVQEGDVVVANHGISKVLGIGTVTGPYSFVPGERHPHRYPVDWTDLTPRQLDKPAWVSTIRKLDPSEFRAIVAAQVAPGEPEPRPPARKLEAAQERPVPPSPSNPVVPGTPPRPPPASPRSGAPYKMSDDTLFNQVTYPLSSLMSSIELGQIALPDIQRPFVWPNKKVRDLFDSMYRGYPVGYLLFWQNGFGGDSKLKQIGVDRKQKVPDLLIVDGQQRLTSLFAVIRGVTVLRQSGEPEKIEIAFNPLQEQFEVADAAVRRDKAFIPNISTLWAPTASIFDIVGRYLNNLKEARELTAEEQQKIEKAFQRLYNLPKFPFTALELAKTIDEEQVAEVFVRINSKGKSLNQADFILTLMSVFWDEGRKELESFCTRARKPSVDGPSPFNHFIQPDPDQLLRVSIALGFRRARLQYVYSILRGKDLETGEFSDERRETQFGVLKDAQAKALDLTAWHEFFKALRAAGFVGGRMISSNNNLLFAYAFFLIGRNDYAVPAKELRRVIARWFFMCALTGRYTGSPESNLEFDLARLRGARDARGFVNTLDRACEVALTSDFWTITLPNDLATSSPRSPSLFAYSAALVLAEGRALFSDQKVEALLDPSVHSKRTAIERHHLFPKAYLKKLGITHLTETNQIANYALVEWGDNAEIGDKAPAEYVPDMKKRVAPDELVRQYRWHALPDGWEHMAYEEFLAARRERIAAVIAEAYKKLEDGAGEKAQESVDIDALIQSGEGTHVEFKSTLRVNLHTGQKDPKMELACLKTIAGFLNGRGGTLIVGVSDDGRTLGVEADGFPNEDKMHLHLVNLLNDRMGSQFGMYVHPRFEDRDQKRVLVVQCWAANSPAFVKDGNLERFYVRTGAATAELPGSQVQAYIAQRF